MQKKQDNRKSTVFFKWAGTITLLIAWALVGVDLYPWNLPVEIFGCACLMITGIRWNEWSIITLNLFVALASVSGFVLYFQ